MKKYVEIFEKFEKAFDNMPIKKKKVDQDADGDTDFIDAKVAQYQKGGMTKGQAIAKAKQFAKKNNIKDSNAVNELELSTYANQMDSTESYPWTKYASSDKSSKSIGNKKQRVNDLSKERFTHEFYKKYPKDTVDIVTNKGVLKFHGIKFNTNYTNYDLIFKDRTDSLIFIQSDPTGFYIDKHKGIEISDERSINKIEDMLQYNMDKKSNKIS